jgi:putative transposase
MHMARPPRIEYEGALYHVLSRGNERRDIFQDEKDRRIFLKGLGEMAQRFDLEIHAYVLMPNHYHLLVKTHRANLSKSLHWLGTTYTTRFNVRHSRSGHLFQGRFKSFLVENDAYLLRLSCYIHRNPLRAGIVNRLMDYRWSSYPAYAYEKGKEKWMKTDLIFSQFTQRDKHEAYRAKVQEYAKEERKILEEIRHGLFLGQEEFLDQLKGLLVAKEAESKPEEGRKWHRRRDAVDLVGRACRALGWDLRAMAQSRRISQRDKDARDLLVYFLWERGDYRGGEIGKVLGLCESSVSRRAGMAKEKLEKDREYRARYEKIKSIIKV